MNGVKRDPGILPQEALGNGRYEPGRHWLGAANAQLPDRRVGKQFDLLHPLAQFIEHRNPALNQCPAVHRRSLRAAIEQAHAERLLPLRRVLRLGSWRSKGRRLFDE